MNKKLITALLIGIISVSSVGCGKKKEEESKDETTEQTATTTQETITKDSSEESEEEKEKSKEEALMEQLAKTEGNKKEETTEKTAETTTEKTTDEKTTEKKEETTDDTSKEENNKTTEEKDSSKENTSENKEESTTDENSENKVSVKDLNSNIKSMKDVNTSYNDNLQKIMKGEKIQDLDPESITASEIKKRAENAKELAKDLKTSEDKIYEIGKLVSIDDLHNSVKKEVVSEMLKKTLDSFNDKSLYEDLETNLYITRFLNNATKKLNMESENKVSFSLYQVVKENLRLNDESYKGKSKDELEKIIKENEEIIVNESANISFASVKQERIVFVNAGDSSSNIYHAAIDSHGMKDAIEMTESEAKEEGYVPCEGSCFPKYN